MAADAATLDRTSDRRRTDGGVLLADALSVNAITSAGTGLVLLLGAVALDDVVGVRGDVLAAVGVGLQLFVGLILASLAFPAALRRASMWVIAADLAWVGTAVAIMLGDVLTAAGDGLLAAVSVAVAGFAATQVAGLRRAGDGSRVGVRPIALATSRDLDAPPARAWDFVADAAAYADIAPGIAVTTTDGPVAEGMRRRCVDDAGRAWSETCTRVEPGHAYRMEVDVTTYPLRYRILLDHLAMSWTVEPAGTGSRVLLTFTGGVKLGLIGRAAIASMTRTAPHQQILDACATRLSSDV